MFLNPGTHGLSLIDAGSNGAAQRHHLLAVRLARVAGNDVAAANALRMLAYPDARLIWYAATGSRSSEAIKDLGVLDGYRGYLVSDDYAGYLQFDADLAGRFFAEQSRLTGRPAAGPPPLYSEAGTTGVGTRGAAHRCRRSPAGANARTTRNPQ